ncbi:MAG: 1-acyl-sn-glycerol-3-phosphate acyltransferase [Prevotellaceae bacterium]|jgi:hypothetical protein|nr:1-acyl-sn-glycerol-3-phosphate acyltransferase [Prevotellaceae bacterium]
MNVTEFDDIRPYTDAELPSVMEELLADPAFMHMIESTPSPWSKEQLVTTLRSCRTKLELQKRIMYPLLWHLAHRFTDSLTMDMNAITDRTKAYTYISNHRDIILDPAFLAILLFDEGLDTMEIAIGDNLLIYPWIQKMVRLNKSFIVKRSLTMRQMLEASATLSRYIHTTISRGQSIWIAQREGRAKDSNDETQESLLKMLTMAGEGDIIDRLTELRIAPLSISYEYDPCDYLKAQEFQLKRDNSEYRKSRADDLLNMQTGLLGYKGHVHFHISEPIDDALRLLDKKQPKKDLLEQAAAVIDRSIYRGYRLYPNNYIADDLLSKGSSDNTSYYTEEEKARFEQYIQKQLDKIRVPHPDTSYLREKLLWMYANPLRNQRKQDL